MPKSKPHHLVGFFRAIKRRMHMTWRTVHVRDSEQMRLKLDNLLIKKHGMEVTIPLSDISMVVAEGGDTIVTLRLLSAFSKYNVVLVVCDQNHLPTGIYLAQNGHFRAYKKQLNQLGWTDKQKDKMWQMITYMKIANQLDLLITLDKSDESIKLLADYLEHIEPGDKTNREGHAAKVYFNELFGKKFVRVTQQEADVINAGLNYGYAIVRAQMARIVAGYGLNPIVGVFHKNEYNSFNLVDDLMEPFRQIVYYCVYCNLQEADYLKYSHRLELVNLLNARVKLGNENCAVVNAMDKYVKEFMRNMDSKIIQWKKYPIISSLEWEKVNEV